MTVKLSETIRVAEKAKSWLDRFPEYRAAIDELIKLARTQTGEPEPSRATTRTSGLFGRIGDELRKAADEFTESMFDLPPDAAPAPEVGHTIMINDVVNDRTGTGTLVALTPHGVNVVTVDSWDDAPAPKPAAPQPGDTVPDEDAALKLPPGTLIKSPSGVRGLIVSSAMPGLDRQVEWADMGGVGTERWPATIVDINVP